MERTVLVAALALAALLTGGCAAQQSEAAPGLPPLGDTAPAAARDMTVLVVGDSWARSLGIGMAAADPDGHNSVVNAGLPGCGIMQPDRIRSHGRLVAAPKNCNSWPERWAGLVERYKPTAVLLEIGYWDGQSSQRIPGADDVGAIAEPEFRRRFDRQMDRAVGVLSAAGARVYLPTVVDNEPATRPNSDAMNAALKAAVSRSPKARLLDLRAQLCTAAKECPPKIGGVTVYDETGHPSAAARTRLGAWLLNSVHADLGRGDH